MLDLKKKHIHQQFHKQCTHLYHLGEFILFLME